MPVVLATRSRDKVGEIRDILTPVLRVPFMSLDDAGVPEDPAELRIEAFDTFLANAHAKAAHFVRITGRPTIADDSGLSVAALGGAPGVHSRRFARPDDLAGFDQDRANNERLLRELRDVKSGERSAHYTCAAVLHLPNGRRFSALGTCAGTILPEPRGHGGFGYDPLFFLPELGRSLAEVSRAEKHRHSHRARAFRALAGAVPLASLSP